MADVLESHMDGPDVLVCTFYTKTTGWTFPLLLVTRACQARCLCQSTVRYTSYTLMDTKKGAATARRRWSC